MKLKDDIKHITQTTKNAGFYEKHEHSHSFYDFIIECKKSDKNIIFENIITQIKEWNNTLKNIVDKAETYDPKGKLPTGIEPLTLRDKENMYWYNIYKSYEAGAPADSIMFVQDMGSPKANDLLARLVMGEDIYKNKDVLEAKMPKTKNEINLKAFIDALDIGWRIALLPLAAIPIPGNPFKAITMETGKNYTRLSSHYREHKGLNVGYDFPKAIGDGRQTIVTKQLDPGGAVSMKPETAGANNNNVLQVVVHAYNFLFKEQIEKIINKIKGQKFSSSRVTEKDAPPAIEKAYLDCVKNIYNAFDDATKGGRAAREKLLKSSKVNIQKNSMALGKGTNLAKMEAFIEKCKAIIESNKHDNKVDKESLEKAVNAFQKEVKGYKDKQQAGNKNAYVAIGSELVDRFDTKEYRKTEDLINELEKIAQNKDRPKEEVNEQLKFKTARDIKSFVTNESLKDMIQKIKNIEKDDNPDNSKSNLAKLVSTKQYLTEMYKAQQTQIEILEKNKSKNKNQINDLQSYNAEIKKVVLYAVHTILTKKSDDNNEKNNPKIHSQKMNNLEKNLDQLHKNHKLEPGKSDKIQTSQYELNKQKGANIKLAQEAILMKQTLKGTSKDTPPKIPPRKIDKNKI